MKTIMTQQNWLQQICDWVDEFDISEQVLPRDADTLACQYNLIVNR